MKSLIITALSLIALSACKTNVYENSDDLPKDIALKPENNISQQLEQQQLASLIKEIDSVAQGESCDGVSRWEFTAIGSKPCGGPVSYIAYPEKIEDVILPKIKKFTAMQKTFNKKYKVISDCAMVPEPTEIKCEEGKAVLGHGHSSLSQMSSQ